MEVKDINSKLDSFVPPSGFGAFFSDWKKEQTRLGFNWSDKSLNMFRNSMMIGMMYTEREASQKDNLEEKPTRNRPRPISSDTISEGNRTRTRTRTSD